MTEPEAGVTWYRAALAGDDLWLALPLATAHRPGVQQAQAALLLAQAEPLLAALEAWLGEAIDPAPCAAPLAPGGIRLEVVQPGAAPLGTRCWLPWRRGVQRAAPALLRSAALRLKPLRLEVELDRFDLPAAQQARLDVGRLLLLPGSFDADWRLQLGDDLQGLALPARWSPALRMLPLDAGAPPQRAGGLRVRLRAQAGVPADVLLGWAASGSAEILSEPGRPPYAAQLETTGPDGRVLAFGSVLPALTGHALRIETLLPALAAAAEPPSQSSRPCTL